MHKVKVRVRVRVRADSLSQHTDMVHIVVLTSRGYYTSDLPTLGKRESERKTVQNQHGQFVTPTEVEESSGEKGTMKQKFASCLQNVHTKERTVEVYRRIRKELKESQKETSRIHICSEQSSLREKEKVNAK